MHLIKFMESHRVIEFCGVALNGELSERRCECCGGTEKCERYAVEVDSQQEKLLCPDCCGAIGRLLHPENFDPLHSYYIRSVKLTGKNEPGEQLVQCAEDDPALYAWGVYGIEYEDGLSQWIADFKTKADAEAWAKYVGDHEHKRLMDRLQPFIENGRIQPGSGYPRTDLTMKFDVNMDDPRKSATLYIHPPGVPLDYDPGPPWYVKTTLYRDKDWHEMVGSDIEDITSESALIDWLEEYTEPS